MSERPGKSRPMPAAPYDDPSIPVLTERLTLPELDLDITLPAFGDTRPAPAPEPTGPAPEPTMAPVTPAPPAVHSGAYDEDTWLVETIPMAPAPLDPLSLDLPTFDLPPLPPAGGETMPLPSPGARFAVHGPAAAPAPPSIEPGFPAADVAIPASLMRAVPATAPAAEPGIVPAPAEAAPTFDRLPVPTVVELLPPLEAAAPASAAFAVTPASMLPDEAQLRESILKALSERLPLEVESILRRQLAPAVDAAIDAAAAQLAADIRRAAAHSLRELVDQAVKSELAHLRESGKH